MSPNGKANGYASGAASPSHTASSRPLALLHLPSGTQVSFLVPSAPAPWVAASVAREAFTAFSAAAETESGPLAGLEVGEANEDATPAEQAAEEQARKLALLAHFVSFLADQLAGPGSSATAPATAAVLDAAVKHLHDAHLAGPGPTDVHSLAASLDPELRAATLKAYFKAHAALLANGLDPPGRGAPSALLDGATKGSKELYALFGGQGMNEVYFDELQTLFDLYGPLLRPFLSQASAHLTTLASEHQDTQLYLHSLSALAWLEAPSTRPPVPYLASCAVSLPLIGLTQLAQYVLFGLAQSLGPAALGAAFKGATGHSQGVVSACVIARKYPEGGSDWQPFYDAALEGLTVLFQIGLQGTLAFPATVVAPAIVARSVENGEGVPSAMLAVTGLELKVLESKIKAVNEIVSSAGEKGSVSVSLFNGLKAFVVTGEPRDLVGLAEALRKIRAEPGKDQSKIPHSKRLPVFSMRFLPIGVPYHSRLLSGATAAVVASLGASAPKWSAKDLAVTVFHTETGADLRSSEGDLVQSLCDQIFTSPIQWHTAATAFPSSATHALDFGTGGASGIGSLCARNFEGRGIRTILLGNRGRGGQGAGAGSEAWTQVDAEVKSEARWETKFAPKLVKTADGTVGLDTKFSRLLSKPPLMVAGMTPTTVKAGFVSAVLKAGYHVELAGGGHYNAKALRSKVDEITKLVGKPGVGITLNSLYINQRQWTFQLPLWQEMKKEGLPIEGLCVAAGIPSTEKAKEIIDGLSEAGIKHVSFKPGSVDGIRQVVNIASANPSYPIILQWTGGRAGGHHSCEDFHAPILATYASIRAQSNIVLVGGSGFGAEETEKDTYPYLSGAWSEAYGVSRMPFDGFLFASRVMVAKEAHTSEAAKQLIVDAKGVDDGKWEETYDKPTGGIITVTSELGEPIHKVATRGVKLWKEFDDKVFKLPKEKQVAWLSEKRQYVIDRLNADFQRPWFGMKADGKTTCDLSAMTYAEVSRRLVRLMYVAHQSRWIDVSLRNLVGDWVRRVEERLSNVNDEKEKGKISILQSFDELEQPAAFLDKFEASYPQSKDQVLASADVAYFLAISQRPGQKPVPFIPVLDASFSIWFKKDSLWQSEDIDAVFDQDPQRVAILQGPVAVKHCTTTQQPIGELLGGIEKSLVAHVLKEFYAGDASAVPVRDYLAPEPQYAAAAKAVEDLVHHTTDVGPDGGEKHIYEINGVLPPSGEWFTYLGGPKLNWLHAFLCQISVSSGTELIANPVRRVAKPRHGQRVELSLDRDGQPLKVEVFGGL